MNSKIATHFGSPCDLEVDLDLPVSDPARHLVPDGSLSRSVVRCEPDVITRHHRAPLKVPIGDSEP